MTHVIFFLYVIIGAFFLAKLEINIEGKYGWAEKLPAWRKVIKTGIFKGYTFTGYHFYMFVCFLPLLFHLPFLFFPWSPAVEAKIIAAYFLMTGLEDILWFAFNPDYGLKAYTKERVKWHKRWLFGFPLPIIIVLYFGAIAYALSLFLP